MPRTKILLLGMGAIILLALFSCSPTFTQPSVTYNSFSLLELPSEYIKLSVNVDVTNLDKRKAEISQVTYTATVEGISSEAMTYATPFTLAKSATTTMDMPLTFTTANALALLRLIENGTNLEYTVTGVFTADTAVGPMDLILDTGGEAEVVVDINDYFEQPTVTVNTIRYATANTTPTLGSTMDYIINATIKNNAAYAANVTSAVYTVTLEGGLTSSSMTYSNAFAVTAAGASGSEVVRDDMPASFPVSASNAAALVAIANKIGQQVQFTVNGTMNLTADIGAGNMNFVLPLYVTGTTTLEAAP